MAPHSTNSPAPCNGTKLNNNMLTTYSYTSLNPEQAWQTALQYFNSLPTDLFQKVMLLSHNLGMQMSETGQFRDILRRPHDYPLFDQPFWLMQDFNLPASEENRMYAEQLVTAALLGFLAWQVQKDMQDINTFITTEYTPLQQTFLQEAEMRWQQVLPQAPATPLMDKWQIGALTLESVAWRAGRTHDLPRLKPMLAHFAAVFQSVEDLSNLLIDVRDGRQTLPIQRVFSAMQIDPHAKVSFEFIAGAFILTGTHKKIVQECRDHVEAAQVIAAELNLTNFQQHCERVQDMLSEVQEMFSLRATSGQTRLRTFFLPAPDLLPTVISKAEHFLLADLTFIEAWEVQNRNIPGAPLLVAQAFTSALVLEVLCKHGHTLPEQVDELFRIYTNNGFGYYNEPGWTAPDADDIAFALRLCRYSSQPEVNLQHLQAPLRWLRRNQLPSGQIPVWFTENDFHVPLNPRSVLYGGECATVEANLLIGLIQHNWLAQRDVIEPAAHSWCDHWLAFGLGATGHYTPLFSLWTGIELTRMLSQHTDQPALKQKLDAVSTRLLERLSREASRTDLTPQDASFLMLACLCASDPRLPFDPNWLTILFKHQNCDGYWLGEPIYITPAGRGLTTHWLVSRTITSAFCYHALKTYQSQQ
jgi:hypothetical protein